MEGTFVNNKESGVWELTQDGQYLVLYFQKTTPSEGVEVQTKVIELVSVDHQTLCLKQTTANKSAVFLTKQ